MDYDYKQTGFSKILMTGLFTGIIATLLNLVYNYVYRSVTNLNPSEIINVSSLIFISVSVLLIAGFIYFLFVKYLKQGKIFYIILFLILTVLSIVVAFAFQRSSDPQISSQFRGLFIGVNLILGLSATFVIPYLSNHDKLFN